MAATAGLRPSPRRELPELRIELAPSLMLALALGVAHIGAMVVAIVVALRMAWAFPLCLVLLLNAVWSLWHHAMLRPTGAIVALELRGEDECLAQQRDGTWLTARVTPSSYVTRWLVVLDLQMPYRRRSRHVVLVPDSMSRDSFRRLRVRLRWADFGRPLLVDTGAPL